MHKLFVRNILIFCCFVVLSLVAMGLVVFLQSEKAEHMDEQVEHTHHVINESQNLVLHVKGMLLAQRGYLLTGNQESLAEYEEKKGLVSEHIASLKELTEDNPSQISRLEEIQHHFLKLADTLEETARDYNAADSTIKIDDMTVIDKLKDEINRINSDLLEEEYGLLKAKVQDVEQQRSKYIMSLMFGGIIVAFLLIMLFVFLMRAQAGKGLAERGLKDTEERLRLALEGTNDGIFDWNVKTGAVVYSDQFWQMLGYRSDDFDKHYESFRELVHPEDKERFDEHLENYLAGVTSEYSIAYRMKHASGQWIWINSRAKAVYNDQGKPVRMVGAHTDINHIKAYEEKLKEAKEKAEAASAAKTQFLAHMSHEIRTPLTAISGIAEILEKNIEKFDERLQKLVHTLGSSTESLTDLITDILDFSKIESGQVELEEKPFVLGKFFEQVVSIMSVRAKEKGLRFRFDFDDVKKLKYTGDKTRFRQVLINLIGNATKFTEKGYVNVKAYRAHWEDKSALRIDVEDSGIGINAESVDEIFQNFRQGDASVSRRFGGTGLGLPISKSLARLMGGDILVESEPGKGSTFSIIVPMEYEESLEDAVEDKKSASKKSRDKKVKSGRKILLVEDYEGNVVMLSYVLENMECDFDVARTGREALDRCKEFKYDLLLMDIQMPEMDGLTATREIRKFEKESGLEETPIIGMTAHATVGDRDKCIEAGMNEYIPKPIIEADLREKIFEFLDGDQKAA